MVGMLIFAVAFGSEVLYGAVLGAILGALNLLCYRADSCKIGSYYGAGIAVVYSVFSGAIFFILYNVIFGAVHGTIVGCTASFFEKRFRGQYADL